MKNLKKAITLVLALIIALSTCMVGVSASATEDEVTTTPQNTSIYFEIPEDWAWDRIYCYIYIYGGDALASWQVKKTKCEILDNNIAVYDTTRVGGLVEGTEYCVIMSSDVGLQTYDTLFTTECLGDTLYCDDTRYENPHDSSKRVTAAFWKNQDADKYGPVMTITSRGNVIGTALPSSETKQSLFTEFLNNSLDNSRVYSGKTDQRIIDDIIVAIGITADEAETIINDTGIQVDWTNNSTPAEEPTNDYFISDAEGADRESADTYAYGYVGDVDLTDSVNIKDATAIQKHAASLLDLRDTNAILADIDFSDNINVKDATSIQKWIAGMEVTMPVYHLLTATDENIEHVHAYTFTSQPVSCDFAAHVRYDCDCGYYYTSNYIGEALGHDWGEWVVTKEPALGVEGEEKSTCSNCKQTWTRTIDMIIEGNQDAIQSARELLGDLVWGLQFFESVDELFERKFAYGVGQFTNTFFTALIRDGLYEIDDAGLYVFKRSDLDAIATKYFGRTYDWTKRTMEGYEYYDEASDTVHFKKSTGWGGAYSFRVIACTENTDGTFTIDVENKYSEGEYFELVLRKTEYGYPAVSFINFGGLIDYMLKPLQHSVRTFDSVDEAFENEEQIRVFAYMSTYGIMDYDNLTCTYDRKDLDSVLHRNFGRTIDWTKLNNKDDDDDGTIEYYDAETDTVVENFSFWEDETITETWEKESVTKNDDGSFTVKIKISEGYTPDYEYNAESFYAEMIMVKSEYGYNAQSLKVKGATKTENLLYEEDIEKIIKAYPDQCVDCRDENPSCLIVNNGTFDSVDKGKYTIYLEDNKRTSATFSKIIYDYDIMVVDDALIALFNSIRNEYGITSYYDVTGKTVDSEIVEMDDAEYLGDFKLIASLLYEYEMSWDTSNFDCDKYNGVEYECISLTGKDETGEHTLKITFYLTDGELSYDITTI